MAKRTKNQKKHVPDGLDYELEVARGAKSGRLTKRKAAEEIWIAIAQGKACENTIVSWCEYVAKQISADIINGKGFDGRLRGGRALKCVGLYDRDDKYREMRTYIETRLEFEELVTPNDRAQRKRKLTQSEIVRDLKSLGHFKGIKNRDAAKTVKRQIDKVVSKRNKA